MLTAEIIERVLRENPDVVQERPKQHVDETGGSYTYEKLEELLQLWAARNEGFEWIAANTSKGPGFRISCPGATGWPDGAVHSESSAPLNGSAVCWVENGHPRFTCKHAHCGEGAPLGKKTWRSLAEYYGRSAQREVLTGSPLLGLPVRPELPIAGQAPWDNAGPTTQGPAHAERGPEEWKPTGRTLLAGRTSAGVGLGVGQGSAAAEGHAVEVPVPNLHASPGVGHHAKCDRMFSCDDIGNGMRFAKYENQALLYTAGRGWLAWDGKRWVPESHSAAMIAARRTVWRIAEEADLTTDEEVKKTFKKHQKFSSNVARIEAMIKMASADMQVKMEQLDTNDWLFNCQNGTIDLHTGELLPFNRLNGITNISPVTYIKDAKAPLWGGFLEKVMQGDRDLISFLQRAVGYSLSGSTAEQCFFVFHGDGANGKSTFTETIKWMCGTYAMTAAMATFRDHGKHGSGIPNDVAAMRAARLVVSSEADSTMHLNEALIKSMTGGEAQSARFLHKEFFEFTPKFKLFLGVNHRPIIKGTDNGIWRRLKLVPWLYKFPEAEQDKNFALKLREEGAGILQWALAGLAEYHQIGLAIPEKILSTVSEYRDQEDTLGRFLAEECDEEEQAQEPANDLYFLYGQWCQNGKEKPLSQKLFRPEMERRGWLHKRTAKGIVYTGIRRKPSKAF